MTPTKPTLVYIVRGGGSFECAYVEIHELDHETDKVLFLKQYNGVIRCNKASTCYFFSKTGLQVYLRRVKKQTLAQLRARIKTIQAKTRVPSHEIPATIPKPIGRPKV